MVQRYREGTVPRDPRAGDTPLERAAQEALAGYGRAMDALALQDGVSQVIDLASRANRYVEETAPWKLAKEGRDADLDSVLANLVRTVARLAVLAAPFIPTKAEAVWGVLGAPRPLGRVTLAELAGLSVEGQRVSKPPPLFPKPDAG
jgi:methionyl-tRNA synthetase